MNLGRIALSALITITLISGLSMAEDADALVNDSINESINATETGPSEAGEMAPEEETAASSVQSLRGSWILNTDDGQISMVVHQSEDLLYGAANSEAPEPWNGVVTGQASEEGFELQILSSRTASWSLRSSRDLPPPTTSREPSSSPTAWARSKRVPSTDFWSALIPRVTSPPMCLPPLLLQQPR